MSEEEKARFDFICNSYRAMMKANENKSFDERRKVINDFRCDKF